MGAGRRERLTICIEFLERGLARVVLSEQKGIHRQGVLRVQALRPQSAEHDQGPARSSSSGCSGATGVKARRRFLFDYEKDPQRLTTELVVKNEKANGLGKPLPKGRVTFVALDADGESQFLGRDSIDHTPKDEELTLKLGQAFDVTGEYRGVETKSAARTGDDRDLRNPRAQPQGHGDRRPRGRRTARVANANWEVTKTSDEYAKHDFRTIYFDFPLKANSEKVITYTIRYQWWGADHEPDGEFRPTQGAGTALPACHGRVGGSVAGWLAAERSEAPDTAALGHSALCRSHPAALCPNHPMDRPASRRSAPGRCASRAADPADEAESGPGVSLTVYNQNFAIVKERRKMGLTQGVGIGQVPRRGRHDRARDGAVQLAARPAATPKCWSRTTSSTWSAPTSCWTSTSTRRSASSPATADCWRERS